MPFLPFLNLSLPCILHLQPSLIFYSSFQMEKSEVQLIPAVSWIPKGAAKYVPKAPDPPSKEDIQNLMKKFGLATSEEDDEDMEPDTPKHTDEVSRALAVAKSLLKTPLNNQLTAEVDAMDDEAEKLLENYDEEDGDSQVLSGLGNRFYTSNDADPYLKDNNDDDDSEEEDMIFRPTDSVIVSAHTEGDSSHLKVWIYESFENDSPNMYIHHDIALSASPLCTAWLDCSLKCKEEGNFIAVGSMGTSIEIWDLNNVKVKKPTLVLGREIKNKKPTKYVEGSHTGSVLALAWNTQLRNLLASASADKSVKIWDVATGKCFTTLENHTNIVQALAWNHKHSQILLSGSFDDSVVMKDCRSPTCQGCSWSVGAHVESLAWDPHNEFSFVASLKDGKVKCFDIRTLKLNSTSGSNPVFTLQAHTKAVCSVSYNPSLPNLLATGSDDKTVKLWDLTNNQPSCIASQNPEVGGVFSVAFSGDEPFLLAIGGASGELKVRNTYLDAEVKRRYGNYSSQRRQHPEK